MMLACLDTDQSTLSLMSIPRDTRAYIPGHGYDKINCSIAWGGPETSMQTVSDLLEVNVNHYALVDFQDFAEIIDILGGITMTVPEDMYHFDGEYTIDLPAGTYQMNGDQALQYVRYRTYAMGDIQRTENQRDFVRALYEQLMQSGNILKLPALISEINDCLETDLSWSELVSLSYVNFDNLQINTAVLKGNFAEISGVSYWQVDERNARIQAAEFFGEKLKTHENVYFD
ncbi:MAG: LCP family protein [Clostridia bacterium]|nr:LCP family protein [Clostridia bacterium]